MDKDIKQLKEVELGQNSEWIVPKGIEIRLGYLLSLISVWIGFAMFGSDRFGAAEWQDGRMATYFDLSFAQSVWLLFVPFLSYSTLTMVLLLWDPERFAKYWLVRLGIYSGLILAIQYSVQVVLSNELVIGFAFGGIAIVPVVLGYYGLKLGIQFVWRNRENRNVLIIAGIIALVAIIGLVFSAGIILIGVLCTAVLACPLIAAVTSWRLWIIIDRYNRKNLTFKILSLVGWSGTWGVASYFAINRVFELYTQLPAAPPNCYIATASAQGHPHFVQSSPVTAQNGQTIMVTSQLQILKAGELVLREIAPKGHRAMRRVYDYIGPVLAARIQSRWSADIGYIFFKPFELVTLFLLKRLLPNQLDKIDQFYKGDSTQS